MVCKFRVQPCSLSKRQGSLEGPVARGVNRSYWYTFGTFTLWYYTHVYQIYIFGPGDRTRGSRHTYVMCGGEGVMFSPFHQFVVIFKRVF